MCSFLLVSWVLRNISLVNTFLKSRGPDATYLYKHDHPAQERFIVLSSDHDEHNGRGPTANQRVSTTKSSSGAGASAGAPSSSLLTTAGEERPTADFPSPTSQSSHNTPAASVHFELLFNHLHMTGSERPQPFRMSDEIGDEIATFNGEIYNWADLARAENINARSDLHFTLGQKVHEETDCILLKSVCKSLWEGGGWLCGSREGGNVYLGSGECGGRSHKFVILEENMPKRGFFTPCGDYGTET